MKASYTRYILKFKNPGGTSRGVLSEKETWFLILRQGVKIGVGECGLFRGLSVDDTPGYEKKLLQLCRDINEGRDVTHASLAAFPSIQFGLEQALHSLRSEHRFLLFPSGFTTGSELIPINGLIWMGSKAFMKAQIGDKLREGYRCLKLKIGALNFSSELELLKGIRQEYGAGDIEIRVDANGAFSFSDALEKLKRLSEFGLHSIEQPIRQGNWEQMAELCEKSPLPIALDEELIGRISVTEKQNLLQTIQPQYLILKPSLLGGFSGCQEWITLAGETKTGWWVTSALESNIGLNAISQWTHIQRNTLPQGLGTGGLFTNNFGCPLSVSGGYLTYDPETQWDDNILEKLCI
jgi:O-succinylbenzoate synthase